MSAVHEQPWTKGELTQCAEQEFWTVLRKDERIEERQIHGGSRMGEVMRSSAKSISPLDSLSRKHNATLHTFETGSPSKQIRRWYSVTCPRETLCGMECQPLAAQLPRRRQLHNSLAFKGFACDKLRPNSELHTARGFYSAGALHLTRPFPPHHRLAHWRARCRSTTFPLKAIWPALYTRPSLSGVESVKPGIGQIRNRVTSSQGLLWL